MRDCPSADRSDIGGRPYSSKGQDLSKLATEIRQIQMEFGPQGQCWIQTQERSWLTTSRATNIFITSGRQNCPCNAQKEVERAIGAVPFIAAPVAQLPQIERAPISERSSPHCDGPLLSRGAACWLQDPFAESFSRFAARNLTR